VQSQALDRPRVAKAAVVAGVLLACALPIVFVNSIVGYLPLLTAVFATGLSYLHLLVASRYFKSSESSDTRGCTRGSEIGFTIRVGNRSLLVMPRVDLSFSVSDLSGDVGIDTKPRVHDIERLEVEKQGIAEYGMYTPLVVNDAMDYSGVRSYEQGDPMKMVHWKLSSRSDEYYTRTFESYSNPGVAVVIDFSSVEDGERMRTAYDGVVESAFSIEQYALRNGLEGELIFDSHDGARRKYANANVRDSFEVVAEMPRPADGVPQGVALRILEDECNSLYSQDNICVCTSNISEDLASSLITAQQRKKNLILVAVVPAELEGEAREQRLLPLKRLAAAGIAYYVVATADDLAEAI